MCLTQGSLFTLISKTMKRFIFKIALFLAIVAGVDVAVGFAFRKLEHCAKGGFTLRDNYICDHLETDILISGSSRCVRHYNPQIISDSLGLGCYNSGQMGNGIILNYGRLRMISERKKPTVVIYDLQPGFDLLVGDDNHRYLTWLKSHYEREGVADIFNSVDKTEKYKMMSQMYRYNSRLIELLTDRFHPITEARDDGFSPLKGELDPSKIRRGNSLPAKRVKLKFDPLKEEYIQKMIDEAAGSKLYFVVSPIWYGMDTLEFQPVKEICRERGIPFIDFSNDPKYVHKDKWFKDGNHMNERGADEFTRDLVKFLW